MKARETMKKWKWSSTSKLLAALVIGLVTAGVWFSSFAQQSDKPKAEATDQGSMGMMHQMMQMQNMGDDPAMAQCVNVCRSIIYPDSPSSLLALKEKLGLSEEQLKKLGDIESKARTEAKGVLTADQRKTFDDLTKDWKAQSMMEQMQSMAPQMQRMMGGQMPMMRSAQPKPATDKAIVYTCPMHPEVVQDKPGNCPKCGMKLVVKK